LCDVTHTHKLWPCLLRCTDVCCVSVRFRSKVNLNEMESVRTTTEKWHEIWLRELNAKIYLHRSLKLTLKCGQSHHSQWLEFKKILFVIVVSNIENNCHSNVSYFNAIQCDTMQYNAIQYDICDTKRSNAIQNPNVHECDVIYRWPVLCIGELLFDKEHKLVFQPNFLPLCPFINFCCYLTDLTHVWMEMERLEY